MLEVFHSLMRTFGIKNRLDIKSLMSRFLIIRSEGLFSAVFTFVYGIHDFVAVPVHKESVCQGTACFVVGITYLGKTVYPYSHAGKVFQIFVFPKYVLN